MIGDDIVNDVGGAQHCGMRALQVRTGKYRSVHIKYALHSMQMMMETQDITVACDLPSLTQSMSL